MSAYTTIFSTFLSTFLTINFAFSTELLTNRSFETPVAPLNGNNFYATLPNWTVTPSPVIVDPVNIVVPTAAYANNPQSTPAGGGRQYLDIKNAGGTVTQSVTIASTGIVSLSAWFSVRDGSRNLAGAIVRLKNSSGTVVASGTTTFFSTDPISLWRQASASGVVVTSGTYTFEIVMDNFHNVDLASLDFVAAVPSLEIAKSADKTGPLVVGDIVTYTFLVRNSGNIALSGVSVADLDNGSGPTPTIGTEAIHIDLAPLGDSFDPAIATPSAANGIWDTLGAGDTIRLRSSYTVTQQDLDALQ
jgi:uncharacterized repeat protein (TIGR01451 family)